MVKGETKDAKNFLFLEKYRLYNLFHILPTNFQASPNIIETSCILDLILLLYTKRREQDILLSSFCILLNLYYNTQIQK